MLFAMGAGDRVVAIGSYDHYPPEAQKLPRVGALIDPSVEQILRMRPTSS
jgi:ABC-type hemin transport system substrate-binding protein